MASAVDSRVLVASEGSRLMPGLQPGAATTDLQPQQTSSINWVSIALNRLPLILIGLVCGVLGGFFYHLRVVPTYQTSVNISVTKKREGMMMATDSRMSYLDDFVAVQLAVIKSPQVIEKAAEILDQDSVEGNSLEGFFSGSMEGLGPNDNESGLNKIQQKRLPLGATTKAELASIIHSGLGVRKDEKIGVVVLDFKTAKSPGDSPKILGAIIKGYQKFLEDQYGDASDRNVLKLDGFITASNRELNKLQEELKIKTKAIKEIHPTSAVKAYELLGGQIDRLQSNLGELRDRQEELSARYGGKGVFLRNSKSIDSEGSALFISADENTLNTLAMEKNILLTQYGKDHPKVRRLDLQIDYITKIKKERALRGGDKFSSEDPYEREKQFYDAKIAKYQSDLSAAQDKFDKLKDDAEKEKELDAYCKELIKKIEGLSRKVEMYEEYRNQTVLTKDHGGYEAKQISKMVGPLPTGANRLVYLFVGGVLGLGAGFGLAYLAEITDRSFQTPDEIRKQLGHPILGHIPTIRVDDKEKKPGSKVEAQLCTLHKPKSTEAEAYRGLRTGLYFSTQNRGHQVIQITSPNAGDGKSTLSGNLSISIAQSGKKVVLIDADMRKPRVHKIFGLDNQTKGLSTLIEGTSTISESTINTEVPNLFLIPCGPRPANPAELLTVPRFPQLLEELRQLYDIVIVDTPPLLAVSDPCIVAPRVDGVILNILLNKSARSSAVRACEMLAGLDARVFGVVVNCFDAKLRSGAYGYSYTYGYKYSYKYGYRYGYGYNYGYSDYAQYSDDPEGHPKALKSMAPGLKGPK